MRPIKDPLVDPPPAEVPLDEAPLVRVIAQVRFPEILAIEQRDFVAAFQEAVRPTYPVLRQEQIQGFVMGPEGLAPARPLVAWRFGDIEGHWRVSLAPGFVALETTRYRSRSDLLERFGTVLEALRAHVGPQLVDRIGVRYIDRITGPDVDDIDELVRPEVRGILATPAAGHATHALAESLFEVPEAWVRARWGRLPPNATVDPAAIEPIADQSWILDLDMSSAAPVPFSVGAAVVEARRFAERIYTIFRWAVTDGFLRRYGGRP